MPCPCLAPSWRRANRLGFDWVCLPNTSGPTFGRTPPLMEAWTLLAGLATVTSRIRIGVLVSCNTFRHPALLAKEAVTVDHISNGRLGLGIGAGWYVPEHHAFGLDFPDTAELVGRFRE